MILEWVVSAAVAISIMVLFSSRYIMRWKLEEIYEKAKKEIDSLERKCEEHIETTKKDRASLNQKLEVMETCKLISDAVRNSSS